MKKIVFVLTILSTLCIHQNLKAQTKEKNVTVIELTQTEKQFETKELYLLAGTYQFRIVNKNVDRDLGFVIQKEEDKNGDLMKTAFPTSFTAAQVKKGTAEYTGLVELKKGLYVYSCPLNPTPHYKIIVK